MASAKSKAAPTETATYARDRAPTPPLGAVIRVLAAKATPKVFRLRKGTCILGAGTECDVVITDPSVSRSHVELALVPEGVTVRDLGSRNGTFYLGQRVQQMTLASGGRIELGPVAVAIDADSNDLAEAAVLSEPSYRDMLGTSTPMRKLFASLARLEGSLVTVLVMGESGVGKELVARALHEGSQVARGPLVTVNCGAIPRELVASELFGHKKGAFTGAVDNRRGAFENAAGGTLFLDEIGELPLDVQPMLLRALESGEVRAVGAEKSTHVRVRVVAATNRDLRDEVKAGTFREDLFYRLAVVELVVAPLRERVEDIEPIAQKFAVDSGLPELSPPVIDKLRARRWPGNVRELRNVVQAYAALGSLPGEGAAPGGASDEIIAGLIDVTRPFADQKDALVERFTDLYLQALMKHTSGNQSAAARLSGLDRSWLWRLLVKHGQAKQ